MVAAIAMQRRRAQPQELIKTPSRYFSSGKGERQQVVGSRQRQPTEAGRVDRMGHERTAEVGDGVGDGERGADALAAAGHVLAEQELREPEAYPVQSPNW